MIVFENQIEEIQVELKRVILGLPLKEGFYVTEDELDIVLKENPDLVYVKRELTEEEVL